MKQLLVLTSLAFIVFSCSTEAVKKEKPQVKVPEMKDYSLDKDHKVADTKLFDNGLMIEWFEKGEGQKVKNGDLILIDYKVRLKNGDIVDGNHLINKEVFPFMVGFNLQTPGWDLALAEMSVGDFARVKIPSHLARGKKGIEGLIPPNADNFLTVRIINIEKPNRVVDGNRVYLIEENPKNNEKFGEGKEIVFHAMVSTATNPLYVNTFRTNQPFTFKLGDQGLVPGLRKALINAKTSDRMYVVIPAQEAYGDKGYLDIVQPGEDLFYNIFVMEVVKK